MLGNTRTLTTKESPSATTTMKPKDWNTGDGWSRSVAKAALEVSALPSNAPPVPVTVVESAVRGSAPDSSSWANRSLTWML